MVEKIFLLEKNLVGEKSEYRADDDISISSVAPGKKLEQLQSRGIGRRFSGLCRKTVQVSGCKPSYFVVQVTT